MDTLESYLPLRQNLSRDQFLERHPYPFLVGTAELPRVGDRTPGDLATVNTALEGSPAPHQVLVTPQSPVRKVVSRGTNAFDAMVHVGRGPTNDLPLDSNAVSKFHAFFSRDASTETYFLTDTGSTNGTYVKGQKLKPGQKEPLGEGDKLDFGKRVVFEFHTPGGFFDLLVRAGK